MIDGVGQTCMVKDFFSFNLFQLIKFDSTKRESIQQIVYSIQSNTPIIYFMVKHTHP